MGGTQFWETVFVHNQGLHQGRLLILLGLLLGVT